MPNPTLHHTLLTGDKTIETIEMIGTCEMKAATTRVQMPVPW